jgi:hypothetical protein
VGLAVGLDASEPYLEGAVAVASPGRPDAAKGLVGLGIGRQERRLCRRRLA